MKQIVEANKQTINNNTNGILFAFLYLFSCPFVVYNYLFVVLVVCCFVSGSFLDYDYNSTYKNAYCY